MHETWGIEGRVSLCLMPNQHLGGLFRGWLGYWKVSHRCKMKDNAHIHKCYNCKKFRMWGIQNGFSWYSEGLYWPRFQFGQYSTSLSKKTILGSFTSNILKIVAYSDLSYTYPNFWTSLISRRSTLLSSAGLMTFKTASTHRGDKMLEYWDTTCKTT